MGVWFDGMWGLGLRGNARIRYEGVRLRELSFRGKCMYSREDVRGLIGWLELRCWGLGGGGGGGV